MKTGLHTVTALTREDSTSTSTLPPGVLVKTVDYASDESIVAALQGQQFLVITLNALVAQDLHTRIVLAAQKAGVSYIMPNAYGWDVMNPSCHDEMWSKMTYEKMVDVQKSGMPYVMMVCSFWYEWSLAAGPNAFGIDVPRRTVTFVDNGTKKFNTSTWALCGDALAALLSLPESGASPSVSDWKNTSFPIASFEISQRDMLDSLNRVLGTTDADWKIEYEASEKRVKDGLEELKRGLRSGFAKAMYSRGFYPNVPVYETVNGVLGLKEEKLDEATKRTVEMLDAGFDPMGLYKIKTTDA